MTPVHYQIKGSLDEILAHLDREKITPWLLNFKRRVNIDDCRGGRITVGGDIEFSGSVRDVYWAFIGPCVEDVIRKVLFESDALGRQYSHHVARIGLDETGVLLKEFVNRVFQRMVDVDRRLRGKGYPNRVEPYDTSDRVAALHRLIDERVVAVKEQYPSGIRSFVHYCERHPVLVGSVLVPVILALIAMILKDK